MSATAKRPTMKDVAKLAGVSYQTVSCVINDIPVISDETRQRVLAAIQQLHYTPDLAARSLRSGKTHIIGLMIPDAHNPHFWDTVSGAEEEALAHGYSLLLATASMDRERERRAFQALSAQRLDGIIPLFTYPEDFVEDLKLLRRKHTPIALSTSAVTFPAPDLDIVYTHFEEAAHELMRHLLGLGHRRIAMIWGVGRGGLGSDRVTAYRQALIAVGLPAEPQLVIPCGHTLADAFSAAEQTLNLVPRPTAIIGINDLMAFGAMQAVLRHGLRVPEDVSIAGFDDTPMCSLLSTPLTTGRADGAEIGRRLVRLVLQRLANPDLPPQAVHLPTRLVVRGSTGATRSSPA
jgi:LacI family transcriptional regulator